MKGFVFDQLEKLFRLKFHEAAGFSRKEFEKYIPEPKHDNGLLIVSERCLNIAIQCKLLGIRNLLELDYHRNLVEVPPTFLYWRYNVDDGRTMKGIATEVALEKFKEKKRFPAATVEVLAIYRENPEVIAVSHFMDAPGSEICKGDVSTTPTLCLEMGLIPENQKVPELGVYKKIDTPYARWGAASVEAE